MCRSVFRSCSFGISPTARSFYSVPRLRRKLRKTVGEAIQSDALALFDQVHLEYSDIAVVGRSLAAASPFAWPVIGRCPRSFW